MNTRRYPRLNFKRNLVESLGKITKGSPADTTRPGEIPGGATKGNLIRSVGKKSWRNFRRMNPRRNPSRNCRKKLLKKPREEFLRELQQESLEKLFERILRPGGISGEILGGIQKIFIHTGKNIFVKGLFSGNPFRNSSWYI